MVVPWNPFAVEEAGYRLRVGNEIFTNDKEEKSARKLVDGEPFVVGPGQFLYVLTEETVHIPRTCIGFISARASTKFQGLVNVSGFQVDPGYHGKLIFALFNAGPRHIHLKRGDDIFSIWISDLSEPVPVDFEGTDQIPNGLNAIPSNILNRISGKALTAYQVNEAVEKLENEIKDLRELLGKIKDRLIYTGTIAGILLAIGLLLFGPRLRELLVESPETNVFQPSSSENSGN
ncbi:hypothetical protein [Pseudoruegeria sp. HB172150]|uniref:dCTP deaminase domain-containing protein n=1 Tax=Pseudoruegeria sp. HB172150 TaxID=2721164 RepID=UPI0015573485